MKKFAALLPLLALTLGTASAGGGAGAGYTTIAGLVSADPQFSTLLTALKAAGLDKTLAGPGPFTVFAPTNEAFAKVPKDALNALLADKAQLKKVLLYHVVSGDVTAAQVVKLNSAKTLEGSDVTVMTSGGSVMIGGATVVKADVMATNGVVHVIDTVLMPGM